MFGIQFRRGQDIAIDLGNNNTRVSSTDQVLMDQPSYIVVNKDNKNVKATGHEAYSIIGKTPKNLKGIKPLKGGVIADYGYASKMLQMFIKNACPGNGLFSGFNNIISGVPYSTTEVEKRALRDALEQFNSSHTYLMYEPLAAAIGNGLNIEEPNGKFLIDIGGGITEIAVISLSGITSFKSVKLAGDDFDEEIQEYFRKEHNLAICLKAAENVKIQIGAATEKIDGPALFCEVTGKDLMTGIPKRIVANHAEIARVLDKPLKKIEQTIIETLEECPPELASDIYENGLYLTGGGSMIRGLKNRLEKLTRLKVHQDMNPLYAVSRGIGNVLKKPQKSKSVLFK